MASSILKSYDSSDRKTLTHFGVNSFSPVMSDSHNYKFEFANRDTSIPSQKKRPTLATNTCGENRKYYTPCVILR